MPDEPAAGSGDAGAEGDVDGHSNDQGDNHGDSGDEPVRDPEAIAAKNKQLLKELKAERSKRTKLEKLAEERRKAEMSEAEKAIEAAEKAGYERAATQFGQSLLKERLLARATDVLQDPTDAVALIDVSELDVDDLDGIDAALKALVEAKPHLKARKGGRNIDQGPQGEAGNVNAGKTGNDWLRGVIGR